MIRIYISNFNDKNLSDDFGVILLFYRNWYEMSAKNHELTKSGIDKYVIFCFENLHFFVKQSH